MKSKADSISGGVSGEFLKTLNEAGEIIVGTSGNVNEMTAKPGLLLTA